MIDGQATNPPSDPEEQVNTEDLVSSVSVNQPPIPEKKSLGFNEASIISTKARSSSPIIATSNIAGIRSPSVRFAAPMPLADSSSSISQPLNVPINQLSLKDGKDKETYMTTSESKESSGNILIN